MMFEKQCSDLHHIERILQDISKQHRVVIFLFKDANGKAVNECLTRLDGSLVNFEVRGSISSRHCQVMTWYSFPAKYTVTLC